ncbi:MAG: hypothetical protein IKS18_08710 [Lachnospiraceae bacterium]|nr:hypothetical protein [Lachnospiraceae bacterium]
MKIKKVVLTISLIAAVLGMLSCKRADHIVSAAKFITSPYLDLATVEEYAEIIVIGRKTGDIGEPKDPTVGNPVVHLTEFTISEIIMDNTGELQAGDQICLTEWQMYHEGSGGVWYEHFCGYTNINDKDPYLLFLVAPYEVDGRICYGGELNYGQVCLGRKYKMVRYPNSGMTDEYYDCIDQVRKEAREKYAR